MDMFHDFNQRCSFETYHRIFPCHFRCKCSFRTLVVVGICCFQMNLSLIYGHGENHAGSIGARHHIFQTLDKILFVYRQRIHIIIRNHGIVVRIVTFNQSDSTFRVGHTEISKPFIEENVNRTFLFTQQLFNTLGKAIVEKDGCFTLAIVSTVMYLFDERMSITGDSINLTFGIAKTEADSVHNRSKFIRKDKGEAMRKDVTEYIG